MTRLDVHINNSLKKSRKLSPFFHYKKSKNTRVIQGLINVYESFHLQGPKLNAADPVNCLFEVIH